MRPAFFLVLLVGCAKETQPPAVSKNPHQIDLTLQASGEILLDGRSQRVEDIAQWDHPGESRYVLDPVRIHVPAELPFSGLYPLLQALTRASRVNIALLQDGTREPTYLPITVDHGCNDLFFFTGQMEHHEHSNRRPKERLWLRIRGGPGGRILVEAIQQGEFDPSKTLIVEPDEKLRMGTPKDFPWSGKHPPLGFWDPKTLREFLAREEVKAARPVCTLEIRPTDRVENVLPCLAAIQSVAPLVLTDILLP